ncbi:calcium and integrin-binding protein 1-like isoform X1 [Corapipo altera]|uniref:calcium and integrin-binding protein 1-like isoform X1 n=1 Tax=Corapipo altera TaxID=415028 RepID=UPI000FD66702|nr:calcium and integrin-binding protein 1-like isoform X1 [Corapipo altera]
MGGSASLLPRDALGEYQELTFLSKQEILLQTPSSTGSAMCSPPRRPGTTACPLKTSLPCIFDFDDDGTLDRRDLEQLVNCLTGQGEESRLSRAEMEQLIQNILEESDIDKDGTINLSEFQHVVSRSPDFASSFKIVM